MIKLLIADDEEWILEGLKVQLPWNEMGITIVGTASNGREAIKLIQQEAPDLIITDIKMPFQDGLSVAEYAEKTKKECEIIIISGYADFHYAQKAIERHVSAYILKPIDREELREAVEQAKETVRKRKLEANQRLEEEKSRELSRKYLTMEQTADRKEEKKNYITVLFQIHSKGNTRESARYQEVFGFLEERTKSWSGESIFFRNANNSMQYVWILSANPYDAKQISSLLEDMMGEAKQRYETDMLCGISEQYDSMSYSFKAFLQAKFVVGNCVRKGRASTVSDVFCGSGRTWARRSDL